MKQSLTVGTNVVIMIVFLIAQLFLLLGEVLMFGGGKEASAMWGFIGVNVAVGVVFSLLTGLLGHFVMRVERSSWLIWSILYIAIGFAHSIYLLFV